MRENYYDLSDDPYAGRPLNWDQTLEWDPNSYVDEAYVEVMDSLYLPPEVWYNGEMKIDVSKVISTVKDHGNTSAASIPLALDDAIKSKKILNGHLIGIHAIGGGLSWGASIIRIGKPKNL